MYIRYNPKPLKITLLKFRVIDKQFNCSSNVYTTIDNSKDQLFYSFFAFTANPIKLYDRRVNFRIQQELINN